VTSSPRPHAASPRSFTAADLADAMRRRMTPDRPQLSPREKEVLGLLADGLGVAAIARKLFISESTAKTHISKIYDKLGCRQPGAGDHERHPGGTAPRRSAGALTLPNCQDRRQCRSDQ
jgi:DNA-binding NarL/FixJ family response regulator